MVDNSLFDIQTFKNQTHDRGRVKTSRFLARIPLPSGMKNQPYINNAREVQFWCESSNLPGMLLAAYPANRYSYGPREQRPIAPIVQDSSFVFLADGPGSSDFAGNPTIGNYYDFFTNWQRLIVNFDKSQGIQDGVTNSNSTNPFPSDPYEIAYKIDYVSNPEIYVFTETGECSHFVTLRDAFPLMVADTRLNWADTGFMRINVVFTYTDWYLSNVMDL